MASFFKTFFFGMLITVLLPFIALFFALFFVYCLIVFIYTAIRSTIIYFAGGRPFGDLPEDIKAKEIISKRLQDNVQTNVAPQMGNNIVINNPQINYVSKDQNEMPKDIISANIPPALEENKVVDVVEKHDEIENKEASEQ